MRASAWLTLVAGLALGLPCAAAPLEVYGRLPAIESVTISPDGQNLALVVTNGDQRKIVIQNVESSEMIGVINAGEQKVRDVRWGGPHHVIVTASQTAFITDTTGGREEHFLATDYNVATRIQRALLSFSTSQTDFNLNVIYGYPTVRIVDGRALALVEGVHFVGNEGHLSLFKVDLDRDDASIQSIGQTNTRAFIVDARGVELAESEYNAPTSRWDLKVWRGHWQEVERKQASIERPELLGLGRDGASILVGFHEADQLVLRELSADGATWSDPLPVTDPDSLIWDPATYKLLGETQLVGDDPRHIFFDPLDQAIWKGLTAAYPDARVDFVSMSDDHKKWVLRIDSPTEGPAYALVDLDNKKGSWIGDEYLGLKAADIAPVTPVSFTAKDGLRLTGYLTVPHGRVAKGLPLIVLPHGGPAVRDRPGFDWWAQALASRGYAVLQVNYRGSDGFGWAFQSQGFGQWGRKMQTAFPTACATWPARGPLIQRACALWGAATAATRPWRARPSTLASIAAPFRWPAWPTCGNS